MLLGHKGDGNRVDVPYHNIIVVGSTGSGKTYRYVLSNLFQFNHSAVVFDPLGYLYRKYKDYIEEHGVHTYTVSDIPETVDKELVNKLGNQPLTYIFITASQLDSTDVGRYINDLWKALCEIEFKCPVHFYLDEFRNLTGIEAGKMFTVPYKHGISCSALIQSIGQIKNHPDYETIINNADFLFLDCPVFPFENKSFISDRTNIPKDIITQIFEHGLTIADVSGSSPMICKKLNPEDY